MGTAAGAASTSRGLLLIGARSGRVVPWVRRGVVAARVIDLGRWTAVCPSESASRAAAPYDDALSVLAARPVRGRLRPALGFFVIADRAVVTAQPRGWRSPQRWMLFAPGRGLLHAPHLEELHPEELIRVAGRKGEDVAAPLRAVFARRDAAPATWLVELVTALGLPGAGLLASGHVPSGDVVEPDWRNVVGFDALMAEETLIRRDSGSEEGSGGSGSAGDGGER